MIIPSEIRKSEALHILKLIEQMTRADVIARLGRFDNLEFADYAMISIEKRDELLEYLYDTSSLVELGNMWKLLKKKKKKKKSKRKT